MIYMHQRTTRATYRIAILESGKQAYLTSEVKEEPSLVQQATGAGTKG
jgi:hypothetical protein